MALGYDSIIAEASRRYGVPESYIRSVMQVESGGRADAVSPKGAGGLMQIMPGTYDELRGKHGLGPDRFDPVNNIMGGTAYMRQMYDQFGNWNDALGAYNAGPGRMQQVRAGQRGLPAETRAYVPAVQAAIGGADVAGYRTSYSGPGATYEAGPEFTAMLDNLRRNGPPMTRRAPGTYADATGMDPEREAELRALLDREVSPRVPAAGGSLLDVDHTNNWLDGLGGLLGEGQSGSQPPGPSVSPLQYQLAGAGNAVGQLAGITNRRVGIGELLGALGGGLMQGAEAGRQAQRQQRADQRAETGERFDNVYKAALARKALTPDRLNLGDRFKVAGKRIFDAATQTWIDDPNAGPDQGGPLDGTGIDAQMNNAYIVLTEKIRNGQQLTPQEQLLHGLSERHLNKPRLVTGPDGVVREVAPAPLPTLPNAGGGAPPSAAPPPGPNLLDVPPPATAPPPTPTVTPSGSRVTEIVPPRAKEIPQTVQNSLLENTNALRKAEDALREVIKAPDATGVTAGLLNMLPFGAVDKAMPGGTAARAGIADIGSMKIHDRSGAAVTVSEFPRLAPFVPQVSDDAATVKLKLERFREELANEIRDQAAMYGVDQGYKGNPILADFLKTGKAPRYEAPISGQDPNAPGAKVMRFDAQGNLVR